MSYLENAIKYSIRNWVLIIPIFVLTAFSALINSGAAVLSLDLFTSFLFKTSYIDPGALLELVPKILISIVGGSVIAFIIPFIYNPATYGLVNKSLETGNASLNDLGWAISTNFAKYLMYFLGIIAVTLACGIPAFLLVLLCAFLITAARGIGLLLFILVLLALTAFFITLSVFLSMWYVAMVTDGLDLVAAAKKSIDVVKGCFWTVLGITLLVSIAASVAETIIGYIVGWIPYLGSIITAAVSAAETFVMIVFSMMLYREKTGRLNA